jgi:hypothetical protein
MLCTGRTHIDSRFLPSEGLAACATDLSSGKCLLKALDSILILWEPHVAIVSVGYNISPYAYSDFILSCCWKQSLMSGSADTREQAADGLGELIDVTSESSLKPFVVQITGY